MNSWCGTTDIRSLLLGTLFILASPIIALWFLGNYVYCKLTNKVFLAVEKGELEEAKKRPIIIVGGNR